MNIMKALTVIFYVIGACLLAASCFTTGGALSWWLGGGGIVLILIGCVLQFNYKKREVDSLIHDERNSNFS